MEPVHKAALPQWLSTPLTLPRLRSMEPSDNTHGMQPPLTRMGMQRNAQIDVFMTMYLRRLIEINVLTAEMFHAVVSNLLWQWACLVIGSWHCHGAHESAARGRRGGGGGVVPLGCLSGCMFAMHSLWLQCMSLAPQNRVPCKSWNLHGKVSARKSIPYAFSRADMMAFTLSPGQSSCSPLSPSTCCLISQVKVRILTQALISL